MWELLPGNALLASTAFWLFLSGILIASVLVLAVLVGALLGLGEAVECPECGSEDVQALVDGLGKQFYSCNECRETFYLPDKKEPEEQEFVDGGGRFS